MLPRDVTWSQVFIGLRGPCRPPHTPCVPLSPANYLPDCIFLQMSHISSHFRAFALLPAADTLLSFTNSGSFSTSQLRGHLLSEAFCDDLLQVAPAPWRFTVTSPWSVFLQSISDDPKSPSLCLFICLLSKLPTEYRLHRSQHLTPAISCCVPST